LIELDVEQAVERATTMAAAGRTVLGIAGCPGAGKSTLSSAIAGRVASSVIVPMDGFHMLNEDLIRLGRRNRKGAPDTFDVAAYVNQLAKIRAQDRQPITAPRYDRAASAPVPHAITIGPDVALVITEGNYLLLNESPWDTVRPLLDEVWFVEVADAVRVPRLIARHIEFGRSPEEAREWVWRSDEANAVIVATTRDRADVVVHVS